MKETKARAESLSLGLVNTLIKFVGAVKAKGINEIHLQTDVDLTHNQYNNFQKLRYHGLVHHAKNPDKSIKTGFWLITRNGGSFLRNVLELDKIVVVKDNLIDHEATKREFPHQQKVKISDFFPARDEDYWQREFSIEIFQGRLI